MAVRVALLVLFCTVAAIAPARAGLSPRAGVGRALLEDWPGALERFDASGTPDRSSAYFRAVSLLEIGVRSEALDTLRGLSEQGGAFSGPALERGVEELFREGAYQGVVDWFSASAAERYQDADTLHYHVGQSHFLLEDFDRAHAYLEQVTAGPQHPFALHTLGVIHYAQGRFREAVEILGAGVEAATQYPDRQQRGALVDRIRLTRARIIYHVASRISRLDEAERARLFELAREQFRLVDSRSPFYADALRGLAWCALELGEHSAALAAFEAASTIDGANRHEDLWAQGRVYQDLGFFDEAARQYGAAREEALARAQVVEADPGVLDPTAETAAWARRNERLAITRGLLRELTDAETRAVEAVEARLARLARADLGLDRLRARTRALAEELRVMGAGLKDYLDRIPAAALFPRSDRARIEWLIAAQQRQAAGLARLEGAFSGLESSTVWERAAPHRKEQALRMWARFQEVKARLADAQFAFLETLKRRVSEREEELERTIEGLRSVALGVDRPIGEAETALAKARVETQALQAALSEPRRKRETVAGRLTVLGGLSGRWRAEAVARVAQVRAGELRLRADAYALDETQALHLWEEDRGKSGGEGRP